jgi:type I restriction enzyme R subunit
MAKASASKSNGNNGANVRANLRVLIRILRKHGYPPDKQAKATELVLEQAEALSRAWTADDSCSN